jgi:anti-sigma factor RsiW
MSAGEHEALYKDIGVYVLGALEPPDRDRLERHLADCDTCREELASMAVLPSLLTRAAVDPHTTPTLPPVGPVVERLARDRRRDRLRTRVLAAAATLAVVMALGVTVAQLPAAPDDGVVFTADRPGVTAAVQDRAWGMAVEISAQQLPPHDGYVAVAVTANGHRTQVASWTNTGRPATVGGACYLRLHEVDRMEILAAPEERLVATLRVDE